MYVDPFWAGVFVTITIELAALFTIALFMTGGKK